MQAIVLVSTNIRFRKKKKYVVVVYFVLYKKSTEGMAKKKRVEGLLTFAFKYRLLLKDSPSFYAQNETTIISKKYK